MAATHNIQDFGEKIHGSKKEFWSMYTTDVDLDSVSDREKLRVTKKDLWKEPDYKAYCDAGIPAEYMFFVYRLYHAVESKLTVPPRENITEYARNYIEFVTGLQTFLLSAVRVPNFAFWETLFKGFLLPNGYISNKFDVEHPVYTPMFSEKARRCTAIGKRLRDMFSKCSRVTHWTYGTYSRDDMHELFIKGLKDSNIRADILANLQRNYYYTLFLDCYISGFPYETATCMFGTWYALMQKNGGYVLLPTSVRCKDYFYKSPDGTMQALYKAATDGTCRRYVLSCMENAKVEQQVAQEAEARETAEQQSRPTQKPGERIITRVALPNRYVMRSAPRVRKGSARPEFLVYDSNNVNAVSFGFRGGEFGNWQNRRQECLDCTVDAFSDLAYVLDLPFSAMSLCFTGKTEDRIALAWGSRGSGRASAHYEPDNVVINLTKYRGAGSLAHEWGHALDHACGKLYSKNFCKDACNEYMSMIATAVPVREDALLTELERIYDKLIETIKYKVRVYTFDEKTAYIQEQKDKAVAVLKSYFDYILSNLERRNYTQDELDDVKAFAQDTYAGKHTLDDVMKFFNKQGFYRITSNAYRKTIQKNLGILNMTEADVPDTHTENTRFYSGAVILDNSTTTKRHYYAKLCELFARAFEAYVEDKLGDMISQYLVYGTKSDAYCKNYGVDLYPLDEERAAINAVFDELLNLIRTQVVKSKMPEKIRRLYTTAAHEQCTYFETELEIDDAAVADKNNDTDAVQIPYLSSVPCVVIQKTQIAGVPAVVIKDTRTEKVVECSISAVRVAVDAGLINIMQGTNLLEG